MPERINSTLPSLTCLLAVPNLNRPFLLNDWGWQWASKCFMPVADMPGTRSYIHPNWSVVLEAFEIELCVSSWEL